MGREREREGEGGKEGGRGKDWREKEQTHVKLIKRAVALKLIVARPQNEMGSNPSTLIDLQ